MGDLKKDVLLLADVFWDAMLKMTGVRLEKFVCGYWQVLIHWKRVKRRNFLHC